MINRIFVLFENNTDRTVHIEYYLSKVEIKDYKVMIDGQNFFDETVKNNIRTFKNFKETSTGKKDDNKTTGYLLVTYLNTHISKKTIS